MREIFPEGEKTTLTSFKLSLIIILILYKKKEKERRFECEDVPETAEIS